MAPGMPRKKSITKIRAKVRRSLRHGTMPLEIARKLGIPLMLVAEIAVLEATIRQAGGSGLDV